MLPRTKLIRRGFIAKVNMGGYEMVDVICEDHVELGPDDDYERVRRVLVSKLKREVEAQVMELRRFSSDKKTSEKRHSLIDDPPIGDAPVRRRGRRT